MTGRGPGLDGSSFVAVQRFVHDLEGFARLPAEARDHTIGRSRETNEELPEAPASAHVTRVVRAVFRGSRPCVGYEEDPPGRRGPN